MAVEFKIGAVAAQAGVNIRTLRFYEREGVIPKPQRTPSGYRLYPADTAALVGFVKRAQLLGYTLREVKELLALREGGGGACADVQRNAGEKLAGVEARIRELQAIAGALSKLLASCAEPHHSHVCPLLEALDASPRQPVEAADTPGRQPPRRPRRQTHRKGKPTK